MKLPIAVVDEMHVFELLLPLVKLPIAVVDEMHVFELLLPLVKLPIAVLDGDDASLTGSQNATTSRRKKPT